MKYSSMSGSGTTDWLVSSVKAHPEGLLLLAAGCALLLRSGGSTERTRPSNYYSRDDQWQHRQGTRDDMSHQGRTGDWADQASRAADNAREYASSVGQRVSETAGEYASAAREYADGTREKVVEQSRRLAEGAQSLAEGAQTRVQGLVHEYPLTVALAGLVAGAAVATAFPATRWEGRALGPAKQRLSEAAETVREKISEAASSAGQRLMGAAKERGLTAEGLKEVAREVAGGISGEQKKSADTGRVASAGTSPTQRSTPSSTTPGLGTGTQSTGTQSGMSSYGSGDLGRSGTNKTG
jgi:hypothetical protein